MMLHICSKYNHEGVIEFETADCTFTPRMTMIADSKRWSRDTLNVRGQKDWVIWWNQICSVCKVR
jgi:hypothetical protein